MQYGQPLRHGGIILLSRRGAETRLEHPLCDADLYLAIYHSFHLLGIPRASNLYCRECDVDVA